MNPILSIIVPVYNVQKYLPKCIDSLLSQNLKNFEIIAVDDGSIDESATILDYYAAKDERVKVIHVKNGGVSKARNIGLEIANGEFIGFVDSDDYVDSKMYKKMLEAAEKYESDCVQCEYETLFDSGKTEVSGNSNIVKTYDKSDSVIALMNLDINYCVWSKIFRKEVLSGLTFYEKWHFAEDYRFVSESILNCNRVCAIPDVLYHYYAWSGSLSHQDINEDKISGLEIYDFLKEKIGKNELLNRCISEREVRESLILLNASIGHENISSNCIMSMEERIHRGMPFVRDNRFMSNREKIMARCVDGFPRLYITAVKTYKYLKGIR